MDSSEIIAQYGLNRSKPYGIYNLAEICLFLAGKARCDIHRDFSPKCMLMKTFFCIGEMQDQLKIAIQGTLLGMHYTVMVYQLF